MRNPEIRKSPSRIDFAGIAQSEITPESLKKWRRACLSVQACEVPTSEFFKAAQSRWDEGLQTYEERKAHSGRS